MVWKPTHCLGYRHAPKSILHARSQREVDNIQVKNVYDIWVLIHLERICSPIDALPPDINFPVTLTSALVHDEPVGRLGVS